MVASNPITICEISTQNQIPTVTNVKFENICIYACTLFPSIGITNIRLVEFSYIATRIISESIPATIFQSDYKANSRIGSSRKTTALG